VFDLRHLRIYFKLKNLCSAFGFMESNAFLGIGVINVAQKYFLNILIFYTGNVVSRYLQTELKDSKRMC